MINSDRQVAAVVGAALSVVTGYAINSKAAGHEGVSGFAFVPNRLSCFPARHRLAAEPLMGSRWSD
jgi:hypothetical protein